MRKSSLSVVIVRKKMKKIVNQSKRRKEIKRGQRRRKQNNTRNGRMRTKMLTIAIYCNYIDTIIIHP